MLGYPGLAVVGELGSDDAHVFWILLCMVLCLPFDIWISVVFVDLNDCMESGSFFSLVAFSLLVGLQPWLYLATCGAFQLGVLHRGREAFHLLPCLQ